MLRLHRHSSRSYPGRPARFAPLSGGAPGVDGIAIEQFPVHTRPLWAGIRESLLAGSYQTSPVRRVEIPKPTGGTRPLDIPTVLDRLIQQAISRKGPCYLSRKLATQTGMTNKWLKDQGLLSVKELWVHIHSRLRPGNLCEPPSADPHAGWCGG